MSTTGFIAPSPFASNPLLTRTDLLSFLTSLLDALAPHTSAGGARVHLGHTATHYDEAAAHLEGFARPLWGLAALLAGGASYVGAPRWASGLAHGADPAHAEFWGFMCDRDQRMVECAPLGFALAIAREHLWDVLQPEAQARVAAWLGGMNDKAMPDTNWLWFRVFANLGLASVGSSRCDIARMTADLDRLDSFYVGGGWSRDGPEGVCQLDYYASSFAIQYAQLVYSKLAQSDDPQRCERYRQRAREFARDFVHYFDGQGRAIPFGRSSTYRFAQSAFWGALAFAEVTLPEPLTWGVIKGLQLRNIRYWAEQPGAYNPDGTLTIGYTYPNHFMTENYNSPGSPYWACKSFITLALPETHPFWSAQEQPYPAALCETVREIPHALHIASNLRGHALVLSSGQQCAYALRASAAKYGKFAYSSAFAFSVPVGVGTLAEAGADSALALSDDDGATWRTRRETLDARLERGVLQASWRPWPDVEVETWLLPPEKGTPLWHVRVHRVRASRRLVSAEGGFAVYGQGLDGRALAPVAEEGLEAFGVYEGAGRARAASRGGVVGVAALESGGVRRNGQVVRMDPNSNLVEARAVLPTLLGVHEPSMGDMLLVTGVFALPSREGVGGAELGWMAEWHQLPAVREDIEALFQCRV